MKTKSGLIAPTVNMNGTSKQELLKQLRDVSRAIHEAVDMMRVAAPHGLDYQIGPETYAQARAQWETQIVRLHDTRREIDEIAETVAR